MSNWFIYIFKTFILFLFVCLFFDKSLKKKKKKKKKIFVFPLPTDPKYLKKGVSIFLFFNSQFCIFKQKCSNEISEYIVTVPKRHLSQIKWNTTSSNTRIKQILGLCMPKNAHTHKWYCIYFVQIKKKKKRWTYRPSQFQAKRANKPFILFFRPNSVITVMCC